MIYYNNNKIIKAYQNGNLVNKIDKVVSGGTPTVIKSPEYISRTSSATGYLPLGEYFTSDCVIEIDFQMTNAEGYAVIGDIFGTSNNDWRFFLGAYNTQNQIVMYDFKGSRITKNLTSNFLRYHWEIGNYYIKDLETNTNVVTGTAKTNFTRPNEMYLFHIEGNLGSQTNTDYGNVYFIKIKKGGVLVKDFIPWTDMNGNYGFYDKISDTVFQSVGQMTGSSTVNDVVVGSGTTSESKTIFQYITDGTEPTPPTPPTPIDYSKQYLTFVAETDNVSVSYSTATAGNKLQYSLNSGSTWNELGNGQSTSAINTSDKILFKASGLTINSEQGIGTITPSASASVEGNIMSLLYGDDFITQTNIQLSNFQFRKLFSGATNITSAENLVLNPSVIGKQSLSQMFQGCTNLVTAPNEVGTSATTFSSDYCLSDMFHDCTSLVNAPQLPMTTLGAQCYWCVFMGCTSLETAPVLPATTLANQCYQYLFSGCTSLNYIKAMFTTTPSTNYTRDWVKSVAANGTFVKNSSATWNVSGTNGVPNGWSIQTASS